MGAATCGRADGRDPLAATASATGRRCSPAGWPRSSPSSPPRRWCEGHARGALAMLSPSTPTSTSPSPRSSTTTASSRCGSGRDSPSVSLRRGGGLVGRPAFGGGGQVLRRGLAVALPDVGLLRPTPATARFARADVRALALVPVRRQDAGRRRRFLTSGRLRERTRDDPRSTCSAHAADHPPGGFRRTCAVADAACAGSPTGPDAPLSRSPRRRSVGNVTVGGEVRRGRRRTCSAAVPPARHPGTTRSATPSDGARRRRPRRRALPWGRRRLPRHEFLSSPTRRTTAPDLLSVGTAGRRRAERLASSATTPPPGALDRARAARAARRPRRHGTSSWPWPTPASSSGFKRGQRPLRGPAPEPCSSGAADAATPAAPTPGRRRAGQARRGRIRRRPRRHRDVGRAGQLAEAWCGPMAAAEARAMSCPGGVLQVPVSLSVGVALSARGLSTDALLQRADTAMYERSGRANLPAGVAGGSRLSRA